MGILTIVKLIAVAAMVAAVMFWIHSYNAGLRAEGATTQRLADQKIIDIKQADLNVALSSNNTLKNDLVVLSGERELARRAVQAMKDNADARVMEKERKLKAAETTISTLKADRSAALARSMVAKDKGETCEETLTKLDLSLRKLAVRELRDRPAETGSGSSRGEPATGTNPGPDTVRLN